MKKIVFILILLTAFQIAALAQQTFSDRSKSIVLLNRPGIQPVSVTRYDFLLTLTDNVILDCTKYIPNGTPPAGGWPVFIYCHGYGGSKEDELDAAEGKAEYGYYTLTYSMRGQGLSGGESNLISTLEMNDFLQVLQYAKNAANVNPNKVSAIGSSQGGIIPFMAACYGAGLKTIVIDLASPEFATTWIENGSIKMSLFGALNYGTSTVRYNSLTKSFKRWILSNQNDKWDSLAVFFPQNRDFMNKLRYCQVPVLSSNAWQDKFFNCLGMLKARDSLHVPFRMYYGAGGHGSDDSEEESNYISDFHSDWEEYWINNENNHILDSNKYVYSATGHPINYGAWSFYRSQSQTWLPPNSTTVNFYFRPQQKLKLTPNTGANDTASLFNAVLDPGLTMQQAIDYSFTGSVFNSKFQKNSIYFESDAMNRDYQMVGTPLVNLHYQSNADVCQYNFQIWDVDQNNGINFVSRINFTDRHNSINTIKQNAFFGMSHSHIFKTGHKIRIYITNLDNGPVSEFLGTNPHVLPVLKRSYNRIYMTNTRQSFIQLSFIGPVTIGINSVSNEVPGEFKLEQNYPNPFNPSTKIRFKLPAAAGTDLQNVQMTIYDMQGREVSVLMNSQLRAGIYETQWNASSFASGVYFCTLAAGNYKETIKMVVFK